MLNLLLATNGFTAMLLLIGYVERRILKSRMSALLEMNRLWRASHRELSEKSDAARERIISILNGEPDDESDHEDDCECDACLDAMDDEDEDDCDDDE